MKRCAKCDKEYEDNYDACPHCAKADAPAKSSNAVTCLVLFLLMAVGFVGCMSCGSGDDTPQAPPVVSVSEVSAVFAEAGVSDYIKDIVTYDANVSVYTYLDGPDRMYAKGVAGAVLANFPEVQEVVVYDGDGKRIDKFVHP